MYQLIILIVAISTAADGRKGERLLIQSRALYDKAMNEIRSMQRLVKSFELAILSYSGFEELVGFCCTKSKSALAPNSTYYSDSTFVSLSTYAFNSTTVEPVDNTETTDTQEVTTVDNSADNQPKETSEDLINITTENSSPSEDLVDNRTENPPKISTDEDVEPNVDQENLTDDSLNQITKAYFKPWIKTRKGKNHHTKRPHITPSMEDNFSVTFTPNPIQKVTENASTKLTEDLVKSTTENYSKSLSEDPLDNRTEYSPETQTDREVNPNGDQKDPLQDDPLNQTTWNEYTYTTSATTGILTKKTKKPRTEPSLKPWTKTGKEKKHHTKHPHAILPVEASLSVTPSKGPMDNMTNNPTKATTEDSGDKTTWSLPETPLDKDKEPNEQQQNFTDDPLDQTTRNEDTYTIPVTTGIMTKRRTKKRTKPSLKPWTKKSKENKHQSKRPHTTPLLHYDYFSVTATEDPMDTPIDAPWNKPIDDLQNIIDDPPGQTTRHAHTRKTKPRKHRTKHRHNKHKKDRKHKSIKTKKYRAKHRHTQLQKDIKHKWIKTKKYWTKPLDVARYESNKTKKLQTRPSRTTLRLNEEYYDDKDDAIELNVVIDI